jgi:hypothetical protein
MAGTPASGAELRPVPRAVPLAGAGFGLVLLAVVVADVAPGVRIALFATCAVATLAMALELRRAGRGRAIEWDGQGGWTLDGRRVAIAPATRVHPGLVVLVLRHLPSDRGAPAPPGSGDEAGNGRWRGRTSVHWVPRSGSTPDAFRRLKSQLRHGRTAPAAERPGNTPC